MKVDLKEFSRCGMDSSGIENVQWRPLTNRVLNLQVP